MIRRLKVKLLYQQIDSAVNLLVLDISLLC